VSEAVVRYGYCPLMLLGVVGAATGLVAGMHRFRHQKDAQLGDVNFGLFTTLVDHILGTSHYEERFDRFASEELGIGAEPNYPVDYIPQLVEPFRMRRPSEATS